MKRKKHVSIVIFLCLFIIFMYCAFYNKLVVKNYVITSNKINEGQEIRIVLITDLHSHIYGEDQIEIVTLIKKQNPDMIALVGDIADDAVPIEGVKLFLEGLKGYAPIYYVTGNHEFWSNNIKEIKDTLSKYDVTILENSYQQIKLNNLNMIIAGVDDPAVSLFEKPNFNLQKEMDEHFSELHDKPGFKVLLAHRPELIEIYKGYSFDLVLSGHSHGGQVRIPLIINGLWAPDQGWFPKYAGGDYKHDTLTHIVSRGVSYNPRLPRVFNPPEVVVIDIQGDKS
ncbi:metallophosphoesterase [Dehalobacter sp. DCM]|uniref:metallophosphoesterase n=1 Tax=Dehalobacter sp. DCM TaxID=2907827 RepID=UPI00308146F1|nr:metallophosphoesterase [Dehalobacter sp. DCM]